MSSRLEKLAACLVVLTVETADAGESAGMKQDWQPSTLSEKTQERIHAGVEQYHQCLNEQTKAHVNDKDDSRRVADLILKNCESALAAVKPAFDAEKVPDVMSERYLRSKRSKAAQQVVRVVMSAQAVRSVEDQH